MKGRETRNLHYEESQARRLTYQNKKKHHKKTPQKKAPRYFYLGAFVFLLMFDFGNIP
jgi:hypothetical protein